LLLFCFYIVTAVQNENQEEEANTGMAEVNIKPPPIEKYKAPVNMPLEKPAWKPPVKAPKAPIAATAYTVAALQQYTNSFGHENLIGEGSLGRVYRAELPDGKVGLLLLHLHSFLKYCTVSSQKF
jgi:hypothetical protein